MALGYGRTSANNFGISKFVVDGSGIQNGATHTTIQSAIDDASSGDTVYVKSGTYTEDLTLKSGVDIMTCISGRTPTVNLVGRIDLGGCSICEVNGISLSQNASNNIIDTSSSQGAIFFKDCQINYNSTTAISINNANRTIIFNNCTFSRATDNLKLFDITSCQDIGIYFCHGQGAFYIPDYSNVDAGKVIIANSYLNNHVFESTGSGALLIYNSYFGYNGSIALKSGSSNIDLLYNCIIESGSSASIQADGNTEVINSMIKSSNNTPIIGTGTIKYSGVDFVVSNGSVSTTNITEQVSRPGIALSYQHPCFLSFSDADTDVTGNGAVWTFGSTTTENVIFDQGSNYSAGVFTAPYTGKYKFGYLIRTTSSTTATDYYVQLVTSNRNYVDTKIIPVGGDVCPKNNELCDMDAGDTARIQFIIGGMAGNTADINGASRFYGELVC